MTRIKSIFNLSKHSPLKSNSILFLEESIKLSLVIYLSVLFLLFFSFGEK